MEKKTVGKETPAQKHKRLEEQGPEIVRYARLIKDEQKAMDAYKIDTYSTFCRLKKKYGKGDGHDETLVLGQGVRGDFGSRLLHLNGSENFNSPLLHLMQEAARVLAEVRAKLAKAKAENERLRLEIKRLKGKLDRRDLTRNQAEMKAIMELTEMVKE